LQKSDCVHDESLKGRLLERAWGWQCGRVRGSESKCGIEMQRNQVVSQFESAGFNQ
jgi:hypothetical protein